MKPEDETPAVAPPFERGVGRPAPKRYPLSVENVGEDTYILMSKGHHDVHEFMRAVRADYQWPLGMPTHEWMRAIPAPKGSGYRCLYVEAKPGARGAFPATYVREAYNEDSYEVLAERRPLPGADWAADMRAKLDEAMADRMTHNAEFSGRTRSAATPG